VLPAGGTQLEPLNVRVLAATHQDLAARIVDGAFRHDLFYGLNVFQVHLPPLRERLEDIPVLARHFLRQFAPQGALLPDANIEHLQRRSWNGNVRELRNALEHAAILNRATVRKKLRQHGLADESGGGEEGAE
jgi:two-component system nitrogen regulation response regulator GlnG